MSSERKGPRFEWTTTVTWPSSAIARLMLFINVSERTIKPCVK